MDAKWIETITGSLQQKRRYRQGRARIKELPPGYRTAAEAVERYALYAGGISDGEVLLRMHEDLVTLFEQAAQDGTPIRAIVGDDPVEFVETFLANYSDGQWIVKERDRLNRSIASAAGEPDA